MLQSKSIEQVAVENLRLLFNRTDSLQALLRSLRSLPHPGSAAVDDLEAGIASSRLRYPKIKSRPDDSNN